jgi:hypothetical protein
VNLASPQWKQFSGERKAAAYRRCGVCGWDWMRRGGRLELHHLSYARANNERMQHEKAPVSRGMELTVSRQHLVMSGSPNRGQPHVIDADAIPEVADAEPTPAPAESDTVAVSILFFASRPVILQQVLLGLKMMRQER